MAAVARLAAIRFEPADNVDALLRAVAQALRGRGLRVRGVVQRGRCEAGECASSDMDLESLTDGRLFPISQPLGPGSQGCRLDPGGLAACSAALEREIAGGCDLVILNRFGRGEAEGRGFRDLIGAAMLAEIPVLTAVRDSYAADWAAFGRGICCDLPPDRAAVLAWFDALRDASATDDAA